MSEMTRTELRPLMEYSHSNSPLHADIRWKSNFESTRTPAVSSSLHNIEGCRLEQQTQATSFLDEILRIRRHTEYDKQRALSKLAQLDFQIREFLGEVMNENGSANQMSTSTSIALCVR